MTVKRDEIELYAFLRYRAHHWIPGQRRILCGVHMRDLIRDQKIVHPNRAWYLLEKWGGRGWYDWGVSIAAGWFTENAPRKLGESDELGRKDS